MLLTRRAMVLVALTVIVPGTAAAQRSLHRRVDELFARWDRAGSPGCALGIVQQGHLVYAEGYGYADLERGTPITPQTVFYLASVSKQFTAAALALLAQDGKLGLDDDVRRWVPELADYGTPITLRHLVHHTSGLRDYLTLMAVAGMDYDSPHTPEEILQLVARQRAVNFPPGTRYLYSNSGYFLIPIIVERVGGMPFREFTTRRLFAPLDMRNTHFHDDYRHQVEARALSYEETASNGYKLAFLERFQQVGSGGLLSTVEDMAKWLANFEEPRVGGRPLLDVLHTRGVLHHGDTLDYAFGLRLGSYKALPVVRHGGSMMGFRTHLLRFPEERFGVICLCNLDEIDPGALVDRVADLYLERRFTAALAPFQGTYRSDELETTWALNVEHGDLVLHRDGESPTTLASLGGHAFAIPDGPRIEFTESDRFVVNSGRANGIVFRLSGRP